MKTISAASFRLAFLLLLCSSTVSALRAQTNVRAWYADGQVWVVWEGSLPLQETYAIYAKSTPFTNTDNATLIGRPFYWEYLGGALKEQLDTTATLRIPDGQGGHYQLAYNEGLFVFTPHQSGGLWFAVTKWGETTVTPGVNVTSGIVPFEYDPLGDPVECHLQAAFPSPFDPSYTCLAFYLWADGRQEQWDNRPDFPVMANAAKNGMPSLFFVSVPLGLDTTQPFPLTIWLHGGGGTALQSLAGSRPIVNIDPQQGVLLAHNDDLIGWRGLTPPNPDEPSWHFGWRKNYDPFSSDNIPTTPDTIINYTQRRYIWIDEWLIRHYNIDPNRININGHSMGSAGTTALAKVYPGHYASATIFNNGFGGPTSGESVTTFGPIEDNYPTNIVDRWGQTVRQASVWNLIDNCSAERDLPLMRSFHGKNDDNGTMEWDAYVVENYRSADSLGIGAQLLWSERGHGIDTGPDYNDHWFDGNLPTQQTATDNVAFEETHFRSDVSFPAFFNHRYDPQNNEPGDGTIGTGPNGTGDDWGSWGGYHRWDEDNIVDTPDEWSVTAWLESSAVFDHDNCPVDSLTASMAIRKPRQFKPAPPQGISWRVEDAATGEWLQSGIEGLGPDSLAVVPQVIVYRENIRRVRVVVQPYTVAVKDVAAPFAVLQVEPNPSGEAASLRIVVDGETEAAISAIAPDGKKVTFRTALSEGDNRVGLSRLADLPGGVYLLEVVCGGRRAVTRWVKF